MAALTTMRNIGKAMEKRLGEVGITSAEGLREVGPEEAFRRLKEADPQVCLVYLYTLAGAVEDVPFNCLPEEKKQELKAFSDTCRG